MKIFTIESCGEKIEMIEIETSEGQFTVMPKAIWDEQQAKQTEGGLR